MDNIFGGKEQSLPPPTFERGPPYGSTPGTRVEAPQRCMYNILMGLENYSFPANVLCNKFVLRETFHCWRYSAQVYHFWLEKCKFPGLFIFTAMDEKMWFFS